MKYQFEIDSKETKTTNFYNLKVGDKVKVNLDCYTKDTINNYNFTITSNIGTIKEIVFENEFLIELPIKHTKQSNSNTIFDCFDISDIEKIEYLNEKEAAYLLKNRYIADKKGRFNTSIHFKWSNLFKKLVDLVGISKAYQIIFDDDYNNDQLKTFESFGAIKARSNNKGALINEK